MCTRIILLTLALFFNTYSWAEEKEPTSTTNADNSTIRTDANGDETSIIRMQNKVIAGIETSLVPSATADDDFMFRTLVNFRVGYRLKQHLISGSLGVEFTDEMFMPLTADYKYYLNYTEKWSPYLYGQIGYSWHLKGNINSRYSTSNYKQIDPGVLASLGFGYSVTTTLNEFYFSLGYAYRDYVEVRVISSSGAESHLDKSMHGLAFTMGLNF